MTHTYISVLNKPIPTQITAPSVIQQDRWLQRGEYIYHNIVQPSRLTVRYNNTHSDNHKHEKLLIEAYDFTKLQSIVKPSFKPTYNIQQYINNILSKYQPNGNNDMTTVSSNISSLHSVEPLFKQPQRHKTAREQRRHKLKSRHTQSPYTQRGYTANTAYRQQQRQHTIEQRRRKTSVSSDASIFSAFTPLLPLHGTSFTPAIPRTRMSHDSIHSELQTISSLSSPNINSSNSSAVQSNANSAINTPAAQKQLFTRSPFNNNMMYHPSPLHSLMPLSEESSVSF